MRPVYDTLSLYDKWRIAALTHEPTDLVRLIAGHEGQFGHQMRRSLNGILNRIRDGYHERDRVYRQRLLAGEPLPPRQVSYAEEFRHEAERRLRDGAIVWEVQR